MTNNLERRIFEHKSKAVSGFTVKYDVKMLIYFEEHETYNEAFTRERQLKKYKRQWKINLIEQENPNWIDFSKEWYE